MTWPELPLKALAREPITNGLGLPGEHNDPEWPRYIRTTDIATSTSLRTDVFVSQPPEVAAKARVARGDILMTAAGATIGKSVLITEQIDACYAGFLVKFSANSDTDSRFISYWTQSALYWAQIEQGAVRSTIDNFSAGRYRELRLQVPPIDEQRRIADFLDDQVGRIDQAIELRKQQSKLIESQIQSLIMETISSGRVTEQKKTQSVSRESVSLRRFLSISYGDALASDVRIDGEFSVMSSGGVTGSHHAANTLSPAVVVGRKGSFGSVHWTDKPAFVIDTAYFLDARNTAADLKWLYYLFQSLDLSATSSDVGVPGLSREVVYDRKIEVIPPMDEQRKIADFLDDQSDVRHNGIGLLAAGTSLLEERKRSLITAAVTGLLTVLVAKPVGVAI